MRRHAGYGYAALAVAALAGAAPVHADSHPFPLPPSSWPAPVKDNPVIPFVIADRLEYQSVDNGDDVQIWDMQGWVGTDWNKFWFKTEGEDVVAGGTEAAEVQALYARLIAPFWYVQAGARYDARPADARGFGVLTLQGLVPYGYDVEASAFVSDEGDFSLRFEAEQDFLFTQRLILQPRFETEFAAQRVDAVDVGQGFNRLELGLRLRYEIRREFAPYIGVVWQRSLGETADLVARAGGDIESTAVVAGIRLWY